MIIQLCMEQINVQSPSRFNTYCFINPDPVILWSEMNFGNKSSPRAEEKWSTPFMFQVAHENTVQLWSCFTRLHGCGDIRQVVLEINATLSAAVSSSTQRQLIWLLISSDISPVAMGGKRHQRVKKWCYGWHSPRSSHSQKMTDILNF